MSEKESKETMTSEMRKTRKIREIRKKVVKTDNYWINKNNLIYLGTLEKCNFHKGDFHR
jgi:hypothetical protein